MGQYHYIVNITKRQFINPHKIGSGLKLIEQIGWEASPSSALFFLLASSNGRGGGDVNDHPLVGSWAGDQIAVIGDYSEPGDIKGHDAAHIYSQIMDRSDRLVDMGRGGDIWEDISPSVREMMGRAVGARYEVPGGRGGTLDTAGWVQVSTAR